MVILKVPNTKTNNQDYIIFHKFKQTQVYGTMFVWWNTKKYVTPQQN